ncbi:MAG: LVIVD repeat-containing protein, partial [Gemmatimonadaceae bacterium]
MIRQSIYSASLGAALLAAAACSSGSTAGSAPSPAPNMSMSPGTPDPRIGLKPGRVDSSRRNILERADESIWNLRLISNSPSTEGFAGVTNSDLAFRDNYVFQGNYNGYQVWDISNAKKPKLASKYLCPASQSDVSVYRNLLFVSAEAPSARLDCGASGVRDTVSHDRIRGIRIFDATDVANPKYIANVQTCRGSHTHTVVNDPKDPENVYVYISGSSGVRSPSELPGCLSSPEDPNTALFRIEVIKIPLANPQSAAIVSSPRIFQDLTAPPRHAEPVDSADAARRAARAAAQAAANPNAPPRPTSPRGGPTQCHDITVYPEIGLAGGACGGYGLLLDIRDVANPKRIDAVADSNFSFWHSATFSNDGSKILFTDEWGGGSAPRCRATDKYEWGANALFTLANNKMSFKSYYKMPAAQTQQENCVAHNGSLIPIPGREVMVQGWYQGGISIFDWTD